MNREWIGLAFAGAVLLATVIFAALSAPAVLTGYFTGGGF